ncbi:MAG: glycerate kinase [Clostridia bacterium]|nr:glycerate kinase [Clostridia bacterium]
MKVVIAIDSLKGSLSSLEAGTAVKMGILRAIPTAEVIVKPVADGGEGTTEALVDALGGQQISLEAIGPYDRPVIAEYGYIPERNMAVMEMAAAAGITLSDRREPMEATTYGVGQMICDAIQRGSRSFIIGIGGSATNDGGIGMLSALGFRFLDEEGRDCGITAASLEKVYSVDVSGVLPELAECHFQIACDVTNPLCGEKGCTYIFGPQKGVTEANRRQLDTAMSQFADITASVFGRDYRDVPGAGAAGGLGFAFLSYLNGELKPGIEIVLQALQLEECVKTADIVVTGEGCLDRQTAFGKAPAGVAAAAKKYHIPVIALSGGIQPGAEVCHEKGIDAYFSILPRVMSLEQAMHKETARSNMENMAEQIFRLIAAVKK